MEKRCNGPREPPRAPPPGLIKEAEKKDIFLVDSPLKGGRGG